MGGGCGGVGDVVYYTINILPRRKGSGAGERPAGGEGVGMIRKELMEGVNLTYLPARKFKTGLLSAHFLTPLDRSDAGANALLPAVLRRGTVGSPDMGAISARLDHLYGAEVDYTVRKKGECQCIGFVGSFIDDAFVPGGERLLEPVAELLGEMILQPVTRSGRFLPDYVESERDNLADAIRSIRNDKRDWADLRLLQELCAGEPYGVSRLGDERSVERVSPQKLYARYTELISSAPVELFYCGSAAQSRVEDAVLNALSALPRRNVAPIPGTALHAPRREARTVREGMDVTQGKLGMGFACGSGDESALLLGNLLFGGSSNSKLFLNVREKLSLCYYASSLYHRQKGLITVSSGVEFADFQRAYEEILAQLAALGRGEVETWELEAARGVLRSAYAAMEDSQGRLENFYLGQAIAGRGDSPEDLAREMEETSAERIFRAMETVKLDTVYYLERKEGKA